MERNIVRKMRSEWGNYIASYNKQDHIVSLVTGHEIYLISNENLMSAEGASDSAYVLIDEASLIGEDVLEVADTRAIDCRAPIFTCSTAVPGPGLEWLQEQFEKGLNPKYCGCDVDYFSRYASFTGTMWDNAKSQGGYLSDEEIENYIGRRSQTELTYRLYGGFPKIGERVFDESLLKPEVCGYRLSDVQNIRFENYILMDTASGQKESESGDDTAIAVVGIAPQYGIYVHEIIADRISVDTIEKTFLTKAREYQVRKAGVEYLAAQTNYLMNSLAKSQMITDRFIIVPIKHYGGQNAKPARHGRLEPYLRSGRLKFPIDEYGNFIKGCDKLVKQMKATPYTKKTHDDCIDALSDICAPEMGIIEGFEQSYEKLPEKEKPINTVMSLTEFQSYRRRGRLADRRRAGVSAIWN